MDQFHNRFPVYDDVSSADNHFVAYGKIPDEGAQVSINSSWTDNPHSGATAMRFTFSGQDSGGFYFLNGVLPAGSTSPLLNFGDIPSAGIDLSGATTLTFWACGDNGGERIDFFVAGVGRNAETGQSTQPFPGSSPRHPALGNTFTLSREWQRFEIDVSGLDLSYVLGGFGWGASAADNPNGAVFFLDDIQYNLGPTALEARLNQPRFVKSFVTLPVQPDPFDENANDDIDLVMRNLAFSYDNALALLAFLAEGSPNSQRRARLIGDAFVYASQHDRYFDDGRIRTAYSAGDISLPPGWTANGREGTVPLPGFYSEQQQMFFEVEQQSVDVGNNAWAMIALLALYKETGEQYYLDTARSIGNFIQTFRNDSGTYQGFQGGVNMPESANPTRRTFASSEHNIDVVAAFKTMASVTGESQWLADADHAQSFVQAMWDESRNCLLAGTVDPESRNVQPGQLPLDVQAWSILAGISLTGSNHDAVLSCTESNHRTSHAGFSGFDFNEDRDGVWFEGTAHMAVAYLMAGNHADAEQLAATLRRAQSTEPYGDGTGISATSRDGLTTGFGFKYFRRLHIATASWLVFAQLAFNPYYQEHYR